nr:MAG TPA: hypothetical protein [Caudoviricetes sp.]
MEIITGYTGKAHVKAEQDRDINQGIIGPGSYVLKTGMQLAAEVSSNNEIKIRDGVLIHQGCAASIKKNTYDSLTIINGSQGMKRIDLIIARYEKDQNNGTESLELKVLQGTPAETNAEVPSYTEGDIQAGDYVADMPLYQVVIDGLNITEVKALFEVIGSNKELSNKLTELNDKINNRKNNVLIGKWGNSWNLSTTPKNIGSSKPIVDDDCYKTTTGANATVTIKQSGLYCVTMYAQGSASQGASACIQAQVIANRTIVDDNYVLFGAQYSYNGFAANVNMSRIIYLENGTVLSPQIRKSDASGAAATTGSSYMEVVKLA